MSEKQCSKCLVVKALTEFYVAAGNTDGKQNHCKKCDNARCTARLRQRALEAGRTHQLSLVAKELRAQGKKRCSACKTVKDFESFCKNKASVDGYALVCAICSVDRNKKYNNPEGQRKKYVRNKSTMRNALLLRNFGITLEAYEQMLADQNGLCAICEQPSPNKALAVDHDHETGQIRQLLCSNCNPAIGFLKESPKRARQLALYLERHGKAG